MLAQGLTCIGFFVGGEAMLKVRVVSASEGLICTFLGVILEARSCN